MTPLEKLAGIANLGEEELARVKQVILHRAEDKGLFDALFSTPQKWRESERDFLNSIFVQGHGAETMAPILQKNASKNVDAWFEQVARESMSDAQRRFPELMKVAHLRKEAVAAPSIAKRTVAPAKGTTPVKSGLSGGSA